MLAVAPVVAASRVPRVVLVVGPVGSLTAEYRRLANAAAAEAEAAGADVTRVYSPNATWPAVRHALRGASIVVYLGHGNGCPSPYRDALYPPTQNGFGLNPVAGVDDSAHQYFGEASIENLQLAPNAVVVLLPPVLRERQHRARPGGGTRAGDRAGRQLRCGLHPGGREGRRRRGAPGPRVLRPGPAPQPALGRPDLALSPTGNGNTFTLASERSPGFSERLDPDRPSGGFYRSLVSAGLSSVQVRAGATGTTSGQTTVPVPVTPSLWGSASPSGS